jgi:hypothetical protein
MSLLTTEMSAISNLALEIMKRVIDENEKTQKIQDEEKGPLALATAFSDFFELASSLEQQPKKLDTEEISEIAYYAMDLVDRLESQLWYLDIHDHRDNLSRLFASLALWFIRRNAVMENLQGTANSFAIIVNGLKDPKELANMSRFMDEVLESASDEIKIDEDRSDPWRPWRVLNLNSGVAATRSLEAELMKSTFEKMERRLPYDLPGFFADGKRQMDAQDVPQEVRDIMTSFAEKWPDKPPH